MKISGFDFDKNVWNFTLVLIAGSFFVDFKPNVYIIYVNCYSISLNTFFTFLFQFKLNARCITLVRVDGYNFSSPIFYLVLILYFKVFCIFVIRLELWIRILNLPFPQIFLLFGLFIVNVHIGAVSARVLIVLLVY